MSNRIVENSVENVKFHRENRLCSRTFELSPPGFQHVEKVIGPLRIVYHIFVENFSHRQNRGRLCNNRVKMHLCGKTFLQKGARPAKAENAADREQGVKTFAGQGQKMVIYWQTKAAYVILQNELSYGNAMGAQCRMPRTFWRVHAARSGNTKKGR